MKSYLLEICCGCAEDVYYALQGGADRVELNSALSLGGLTPSMGSFLAAKDAGIPIMLMLRPRDGGFCYTDFEFNTMLLDARFFAAEGADGLVFGVLNGDGTIDLARNRILIDAAGDRTKVFHRAFDVVPDWKKAMDELVELGFDRILTSGQAVNSIEGADTIKEMIEYAAGRIEILPGGGIRPHNIKELIDKTGCDQVHASAGTVHIDSSCRCNPTVHFNAYDAIPEDEYKLTDVKKVQLLCV